MTWRTEIFTSGQWADRGLVFATQEEAHGYGKLLTRHTQSPYRAVVSTDPVNYCFNDGVLSLYAVPQASAWDALVTIRNAARRISPGTP